MLRDVRSCTIIAETVGSLHRRSFFTQNSNSLSKNNNDYQFLCKKRREIGGICCVTIQPQIRDIVFWEVETVVKILGSELWTFNQLVEYGKANCGANQLDGVPWSFTFYGIPVSHETNDCYIIGSEKKFTRDHLLIVNPDGEVLVRHIATCLSVIAGHMDEKTSLSAKAEAARKSILASDWNKPILYGGAAGGGTSKAYDTPEGVQTC